MSGVAVVTGAGGGIGAATAARLARDGFRVWLGDVDRARSEEAADRILSAGGSARSFVVDVGTADSVTSAFDLIAREEPGIDVLVNNAGVVDVCRFENATQEMWERIYRINVVGTFLCIQAALPALRAASPGARIINVASGAGKMPGSFTAAYNASKAAVISLTRSAAAYLAPGVLVNSVCPGVVDTAMWQLLDRRLAEEGAGEAASLRGRVAALPIKRAATADDVAGAIAFLAGPDGAYVVGEDLNVSGGYVMH